MRMFRVDDTAIIQCKTTKTRQGFNHLAHLYVNGVKVDSAKCEYINRTWEEWPYQSVLYELLNTTRHLTPHQIDELRKALIA